MEPKQIVTT